MTNPRMCSACQFYADDFNDCRRYAPKPTRSGGMAEWPSVNKGDWCGEWAPIKSSQWVPIDPDTIPSLKALQHELAGQGIRLTLTQSPSSARRER